MQKGDNCQKHVWLLSGTSEGPPLAVKLASLGWKVSVSVVSHQAARAYDGINLDNLWVGSLGGQEGLRNIFIKRSIDGEQFDFVIDATHPFALVITSNLFEVCSQFHQPLIRFERPLVTPKNVIYFDSLLDLHSSELKDKNVLLALGVRDLREASKYLRKAGANVFARILPSPGSLQKALSSSIPESHLAILHPKESQPNGFIERALCHQWSISTVVCRQSGGPTQHIWEQICIEKELQLWMVPRPVLPQGLETFADFRGILKRISY